MEGAQTLTAEMDVYAFAICCWEILNMGALPWPLMDDSAVRHFVLSGYQPLRYLFRSFSGSVGNTPLSRSKHEALASALQSRQRSPCRCHLHKLGPRAVETAFVRENCT